MFRHIFRRKRRRPFYAWQVELTTRCGLECAMCIRAGGRDVPAADMSMDDFRRLVPWFGDVEAVVLEGWGEPLLYPSLIDCIRLVKEAGSLAGFVTSGQGVDRAYARELIGAGTDFIGFSLSGAAPETHNRIRAGSDFDESVERVRLLTHAKGELKSETPRIHLAYLMVKENMEELPDFVGLADSLGVGEIVLLNQVVEVDARQEAERVFDSQEAARYSEILKETAIRAARYGIRLVRPSLYQAEVAVCAEDPLRNLYIAVTGDVSPCVYLNPPLPGYPGTVFGNIFRQSLPDIWNGEEYRRFRELFEARKRTLDEIHARLGGMGPTFPPTEDLLAAPPEPCGRCPRIMGA